MPARAIARNTPRPQRELLIAHIDGPQELAAGEHPTTRNSLIGRGLLRFDNPQSLRPKSTIITELGREVLCFILGDYADALVRVGALEAAPVIVLKRAPRIAAAEPFEIIVASEREEELASGWRSGLTAR